MSEDIETEKFDDDHLKLALEDARGRHAAVIELTLFIDRQAMQLLRLFVSLAIATAGAALAGLGESAIVPPALAWGFGAAALTLVAGSVACLRTMAPAKVPLPGEGADWWLYSVDHGGSFRNVAMSYLRRTDEFTRKARTLNETSGSRMKWAKRAGWLAPLIALAAGVVYAVIA